MLIGDRHIVTQDAPSSLINKELADIKSAKKFLSQMSKAGLLPTLILESSKLSLMHATKEDTKSELLYGFPNAVVKQKRPTKAQYVLTDNVRDGVKDVFIVSTQLKNMLAQEFVQYLQNKTNKSYEEEKSWDLILRSSSQLSYMILAEAIEGQIKHDSDFKRIYLELALPFFDRLAKAKEFSVPLSKIASRLNKLRKDFEHFASTEASEEAIIPAESNIAQINSCKDEIRSYLKKTKGNKNNSIMELLANQIENTQSYEPLKDIDSGGLNKCMTLDLADIAFLRDSLKSQAQGKNTVVFAGYNHVHDLKLSLIKLGYEVTFAEGTDQITTEATTMNAWNSYDAPIEQAILTERFEQAVETFKSLENKDEL